MVENSKQVPDEEATDTMQEMNIVLKSCSFGRFHVRLLCTSFFAFVNSVLIGNTSAYILPFAECDLNMNLVQKGILNATPFIGMVVSSPVAGFLTDTFGRKIFLVAGYGGISLFTMFSGISQSYEMLIIGKFFEGLLFAAAYSPTLTFTAEFCHDDIRDRVLLFQSAYQSISVIILAIISWGVLTQEWTTTLFNGYIVLNTWNYYLLISSLWPLTASILYYFLPESPKYLLTRHRYDEARDILIKMYKENTRQTTDKFPHPNVWKNETRTIHDTLEKKQSFGQLLITGLHNCKPMFRKPLGPYLAVLCIMNFMIMALYNVIRMWFPQLSTIVEHYHHNTDANQDLCTMIDAYTSDEKYISLNLTGNEACVPTKSGTETYINSIILGSACILPFLISGVLVNKVGKRYLMMAGGALTIGCTLWLRWASTTTEVVGLFAVDLAISLTLMSLVQAVAVEVFPTNMRTMSISLVMMSGRTGSLVGNIVFPILLAMGCSIPFFALTGLMTCVTALSTFLPIKKK